MPLFTTDQVFTHGQRSRRWISAIAIIVLALAYAIWAAFDCAQIQFGYVAGYSFAAMFFFSLLLAFIGLWLLVYWRTRSTGAALVLAGLVMYLSFLGSIQVLKRLDRVAWMHEPPEQRFGPDQPTSLVIYYRPNTSESQIEDFVEHKLENYPSSIHDGKDYPDFVTEYLGLIPTQANGYEGSAINFKPGSRGPEVDAFVAMIQADPRVLRIFRNTSPDAIHLPESEQAPLSTRHEAHPIK